MGAFNLGKVFKDTLNFVNGLSFLSLIVGLVTILAGVIGIGNILLISVNERTKKKSVFVGHWELHLKRLEIRF